MLKNRTIALMAALALPLAACGGNDADVEAVSEEVVTQPVVEQVEVPVLTEDTAIVRTEVEMNVNRDTIPVDGSATGGAATSADTLRR